MLTVLTPSTVEAFGTTSALREFTGTTSTVRDAAQANALKYAVSWAESYIRRPIRLQTYGETVAGYGSGYLLLSNRPVRQIHRVFSGTATSAATEYASTEFGVDKPTGRIYRGDGFGWTARYGGGSIGLNPIEGSPVPFSEVPTYYVEYSAGWVGDEGTTSTADGTTSTGRTLPKDVEMALYSKAGEWMAFGAIGGPGVMSKSVGDLSISYGSTAGGAGANRRDLPEALLDQYRSIV